MADHRAYEPAPDTSDSLTFIGTATTLLRIGSFTLLTDPNFLRKGQRAYLGKGLWSRRLTDPVVALTNCLHWTPWSCPTCMETTGTGWRGAVSTSAHR